MKTCLTCGQSRPTVGFLSSRDLHCVRCTKKIRESLVKRDRGKTPKVKGQFEKPPVKQDQIRQPEKPKPKRVPWWAEGLTLSEYQELNDYCRQKVYREDNREKVRSRNSARKDQVKAATPRWLTETQLKEIEGIFLEAQLREQEEGVPYEVDHVVPIKGKDVCGLHVPWNLQVLPKSDNRRKSNKYMP